MKHHGIASVSQRVAIACRPNRRTPAFAPLVAALALLYGPIMTPSAAWAQQRPAAPQLLPDTTMVYFRVGNAQEALEKLQETSLGRMVNDPEIRPFLEHLYGSALEAYEQIREEIGLELAELLSIPQGELCFAIVTPPEGDPTLALFVEVRDRMEEAETLIDRGFQEAGFRGAGLRSEQYGDIEITILGGRDGRPPLAITTHEGLVLITTDAELTRQILEVWLGGLKVRTLADHPQFTTIMGQSVGTQEERPQASWYVNPIGLFRGFTRGNLGAALGLAMLEPLGLTGLEAMGGSFILAPEEFDSIAHFHLLLKHPREGVLKMLAMRPGDITPEDWVPADVAGYTTLHWDLDTTFGEMATMYDLIRLEEGGFTQLVQQNISNRLGADFQKEVLPELAGRFTMVSWIQRPIRLNSEATALGILLRDGDRFRPVLEKILDNLPEDVTEGRLGALRYYHLTPPQPPQNDFEEEMIRPAEPCLMLMDDYLFLSNSVALLERIADTRSRPGSSLANDLEYLLVAETIERHSGGRRPGLGTFSRPEENFRALYELATAQTTQDRLKQARDTNRVFDALDGALTTHPLPRFEVIAKYLAPGGSVMVSDNTGFHWVSFGLRREE